MTTGAVLLTVKPSIIWPKNAWVHTLLYVPIPTLLPMNSVSFAFSTQFWPTQLLWPT